MPVTTRFLQAICLLALPLLAACSASAPSQVNFIADPSALEATVTQERAADIAALAQRIRSLGPLVDPDEAARAARITYVEVARLRQSYQITDGALLHNWKVNQGIKPRGLCWHWAEDLETRLAAEQFRTLDLHRAIANYDNLLLEHSTTIVSAKGASMFDGVVLDPWRNGGELFWESVRADTRYNWTPRQEVFDWKRARGELTTRYVRVASGEGT